MKLPAFYYNSNQTGVMRKHAQEWTPSTDHDEPRDLLHLKGIGLMAYTLLALKFTGLLHANYTGTDNE